MENGTIIFLNGAGSSGKTSIARELQNILPSPFLHVALDTFLSMVPSTYLDREGILMTNIKLSDIKPSTETPITYLKIVTGFHHSSRALSITGNNIILDHVLRDPKWTQQCLFLFSELKVYFVGVNCTLEELEKREKARGDRPIGLAKFHLEGVHTDKVYDIEVDTCNMSSLQCANEIIDYMNNNPNPSGFRKMKENIVDTEEFIVDSLI